MKATCESNVCKLYARKFNLSLGKGERGRAGGLNLPSDSRTLSKVCIIAIRTNVIKISDGHGVQIGKKYT